METSIINSNKSFSSQRFGALMKADFIINRSNYLKLIIGGLGIFVALALLVSIPAIIDMNSLEQMKNMTGRIVEDAIETKQHTYAAIYSSISVWVFSIGMTILGSLTFNNLSSKRKRISALMLPASQTEKFMLRFLIYFVGGTLGLTIGLLFGIVVCQLSFGGGQMIFKGLFEFLTIEFSGYVIAAFILLALFGNSLYALGSSLWPKLSWIKTWVAVMMVEWVGAVLMIFLSSADISWYSFFFFWSNHVSLLKWSGLGLLAALNIACWIFAWIRYRNTQIIQRFMTK